VFVSFHRIAVWNKVEYMEKGIECQLKKAGMSNPSVMGGKEAQGPPVDRAKPEG
jgi:hypothetical protein